MYVILANSQIVISTRNGVWTDPTTWSGGIVPTSVNATQIIIDHEVEVPGAYSVSVFRLVVNNKLTLKTSATLNILADGLTAVPDLQINGTLVCEDNSVLNGTSIGNTSFESGSVYIHQQGPLGFIPYATWNANSTFLISGFKDSGYVNIAHSDSWKQNFGNVVYDCPGQTIFVVDLNGYLRNIAGDFTIKNTNNKTLRFSTTQNPVIAIGGSLTVEGPSEIWFSTNGTSTTINIQKDFNYRSSSSGPSYLATKGVVAVNVFGNMDVSSPGPIRMTSSSADSIGARQATLNLSGNLTIALSTIIAPPLGSGLGKIVFNGTGVQDVSVSPTGNSFQGNLDYVIEQPATVNLGNSALSNTSGALRVKGRLQLGSGDLQGAIQMINKGNVHISGPRVFDAGSTIEYNGSSPQYIGNGHPLTLGVHLVCNNPTKLSLLQHVVVGGNFNEVRGEFDAQTFDMSVHGDLMLADGTTFFAETIRLVGNQNQNISASGLNFKNLTLNKSGNSNVTLLSPLNVEGIVSLETENSILNSNGYLTLLSTSDGPSGTACVGTLPSGSAISGSVTVQRYMSGEGRIYRYISSPISNATVASLMDDFPITGSFADPSSGSGINSSAPSFYYYDQSKGGLQDGWIPYPTTGLSSANSLEKGRGYAAFIRKGTGPTIWDVTGNLNQGDIDLPVAFTANNAPSNGWSLVGNPYACTIDWDITGDNGWTKQNISEVISIRDNGVGGGGIFQYWDGDINYSDIPNGHIASGQSIWIRATGNNPVLTIREGVKVTGGASFYREAQENIPSFALLLKKDTLIDKAYFKVRANAKKGLDDWDAVKMENDNFDISTLADSISLAINAQNRMLCNNEIIQVGMKDLDLGTYSLSLVTKFDFTNFTYTWIDHHLKRETTLLPGKEITFEVTSNRGSSAFDRFALRLDELLPIDTLHVTASPVVCENEDAFITIKGAQAGMHYTAWIEGGKQLSRESTGIGADLKITLPADSLPGGAYKVMIKARSVCYEIELLSTLDMITEGAPLISVSSTSGCMGSSVTLTASADRKDVSFYWFDSEESSDTLAATADLITPVLMKRKIYFVSGANPLGCTSERHPVVADIIQYDSARIDWIDANTLASNYGENNAWFCDGLLLQNEMDQQLHLNVPGIYTLQVNISGCITSDTIEFMINDINANTNDCVRLYPNPVRDQLYVQTFGPDSMDIEIRNTLGMAVWNGHDSKMKSGTDTINVRFLPEGIYFIILKFSDTKTIVRFMKYD